MPLVALQCSVLVILIIVANLWHLIAKEIVASGFGLIAIVAIFLLLPTLSRHLD